MKLCQRQISVDLDEVLSSGPAPTIVIASTPHCGRHLLGQAWAITSFPGVPVKSANLASLADWAHTTTDVGVFATQELPTRLRAMRLSRAALRARS